MSSAQAKTSTGEWKTGRCSDYGFNAIEAKHVEVNATNALPSSLQFGMPQSPRDLNYQ